MNTNSTKRQQVANSLRDKEYRDAFVAEHVRAGIALQFQEMREDRGWTQAELGQRAGMVQERISVIENPDAGQPSVNTLLRLASAFDVALIVRCVPFSQLVEWAAGLTHENLAPPSFDADPGLKPTRATPVETRPAILKLPQYGTELIPVDQDLPSNVVPFNRKMWQSGTGNSESYPESDTSTHLRLVRHG